MSIKDKVKAALLAEKAVKNCLYCYGLQCEIQKCVQANGVSTNLPAVLKHLVTCKECKIRNQAIIAHAKEGHP